MNFGESCSEIGPSYKRGSESARSERLDISRVWFRDEVPLALGFPNALVACRNTHRGEGAAKRGYSPIGGP